MLLPIREPWYHLTGGEAFYADRRKQQIVVAMNRRDLRILKLNTTIATSDDTTFIAYNDSAVSDFSNNSVIPVSLFNAVKLESGAFIEDITRPSLEAFDLDLNRGTLTLSFDDVMDIQSLRPTQIQLLSYPNDTLFSYTLQGGYYEAVSPDLWDDYNVTFYLEFDDLNAIKILTELATEPDNTYISITRDVMDDIYRQKSQPVLPSNALKVQTFTPDTKPPELLNYTLDIDSGLLSLTFSEAVLPSSLIIDGITIASSQNQSQSYSYTFSRPPFIPDNETGIVVLNITLDLVDNAGLQSMTGLALTPNDTFLSIKNGSILDMNGNWLVPIGFEDGLIAVEVIEDTTNPRLDSFELNLNDNYLLLSFTEAVDPSTLNLSSILIYNSSNSTLRREEQTLSPLSRVTTLDNSAVLRISLTSGDEDDLKQFLRPIANSMNDTFLSMAYGGVYDYVRLPLDSSSEDIIQVKIYYEGE